MAVKESYAGKINRKLNKKLRVIAVAAGREKADLVLKNATYVNVFSGELEKRDIAVAEGLIVGLGSYSGAEEVDMTGKIVCPGFIDAHIHLESSLVSPAEFARAVIPHGTTTVITDPHEITNVMGEAGIEYMLASTELSVKEIAYATGYNSEENFIHSFRNIIGTGRKHELFQLFKSIRKGTAPFGGGVISITFQSQITRHAGQVCRQGHRMLRRNGIPDADVGIVDTLLHIPGIRKNASRYGKQ